MHILHCLLPELSPKCIHHPQKAYISIVFNEKYPIIAYNPRFGVEISPNCIIILELKFKYPLIAYIILGLKKVQNIFKPDNRLGGSTYRIHFVLRSFVDMVNSDNECGLTKKY